MKDSMGDRAFGVGVHIMLALLSLICVIPVLHVLAESVSSSGAILAGDVFIWPIGFNMDAYRLILNQSRVPKAFMNSVIITIGGLLTQMLFTILAAYPLSKRYFIGRRVYNVALVFTMMFGAGLIPNYLLINMLGLIDRYWALWLPSLVGVYNTMVLRTQFESFSAEMEESARIDGAGEWKILFSIYLPLSKATCAALALFIVVGCWNMFRPVLLYISSSSKQNLAVYVQNMIAQQRALQELNSNADVMDIGLDVVEKSVQSAGVTVLLIPIFAIYPFLQRYFTKGIMIGAIKG